MVEHAADATNDEIIQGNLPFPWPIIVEPIVEIHPIDYDYTLDLSGPDVSVGEILAGRARHVTFAQTNPATLARRRRNVGEDPKFSYAHLDDASLEGISDQSISFFITCDWMVQFDIEMIQAYLSEAFRVMAPGANGFFHYSNYLGTSGDDRRENLHARGFMSREIFDHCASNVRFSIIHSSTISWEGIPDLDGIALLRKPLAAWRLHR